MILTPQERLLTFVAIKGTEAGPGMIEAYAKAVLRAS
jgi:hypothetical protein